MFSILISLFQAAHQDHTLEDRILGCNPVLEAFGNAKTVSGDRFDPFCSRRGWSYLVLALS